LTDLKFFHEQLLWDISKEHVIADATTTRDTRMLSPRYRGCTCYEFRSDPRGAPLRWLRRLGQRARRRPTTSGYPMTNGGIIGQLLQPVRVLQAMTQVHSNHDTAWLAAAQTTVFGARRNSM